MKRIVLGIQYDGVLWNGWQTQPDGKTVQDRLEAAIEAFCKVRHRTCCAGRTDAGVHALEQIVHLDTELERPLYSWVRGVNAFLPPSIAVLWSVECPVAPHNQPVPQLPAMTRWPADDFHARYSAQSRTYHYVLHRHPVRSPLLVGRAGWVHHALDVDAMREAAQALLGEHDFSSFRGAFCQAATPVRTIFGIELTERNALLIMTIRGNAFLHHMVRNIMGSLIFVGRGKRPPAWMAELLAARDRTLAAPTFMPDGLYLSRVDYDERWQLPQAAPDRDGWW